MKAAILKFMEAVASSANEAGDGNAAALAAQAASKITFIPPQFFPKPPSDETEHVEAASEPQATA